MKQNLTVAVLLCLLLTGGSAFSQEASGPLSLKDCIHIALENNVTVLTSRNDAKSAAVAVKSSYSSILPNIRVSASGNQFQSGSAVFIDNVPVGIDSATGQAIFEQRLRSSDAQKRNSYSANLSVDQTIFDGGNWWNSIRKGKVDRDAAEQTMNSQVNGIIRQVAQYYFDLLKQEKIQEVNKLAVTRSQDNLDKSQKMFEIGSVAKVDVFRAKVTYGNDRIALLNQRTVVQNARQNLNITLGRDPEAKLEISSDVLRHTDLPEIDELMATAIRQHPQLRSLELEHRSRELNVALARSVFLPNVSGFFRYNRDNSDFARTFTENYDQNWSTVVGLQVSYNLFNGFNDQVNVQQARISSNNALLNLADFKRSLRADVARILNSYRNQLEIIEINKENLEASREEYRLATERFRLGAGTSLDVREAQVNLTDAERSLVAAEYDLIITYAELYEAIGGIQDAF